MTTKQHEDGFITMIILMVIMIGAIVGVAWWRVHGATLKKQASAKAQTQVCQKVADTALGSQLSSVSCK